MLVFERADGQVAHAHHLVVDIEAQGPVAIAAQRLRAAGKEQVVAGDAVAAAGIDRPQLDARHHRAVAQHRFRRQRLEADQAGVVAGEGAVTEHTSAGSGNLELQPVAPAGIEIGVEAAERPRLAHHQRLQAVPGAGAAEMVFFHLVLQRGEGVDVTLAPTVAHIDVAAQRGDVVGRLALDPPAETVVAVVGVIGRAEIAEGALAALRQHHRRLHLQAEQVAILEADLAPEAIVRAVAQTIDHAVALHLLDHHLDRHGRQAGVLAQRQQVGQGAGRIEVTGFAQPVLELQKLLLVEGIAGPEGAQVLDDAAGVALQPLDDQITEGDARPGIDDHHQTGTAGAGIDLGRTAGDARAQVALGLHRVDQRILAALPAAADERIPNRHAEAAADVVQGPVVVGGPLDPDVQRTHPGEWTGLQVDADLALLAVDVDDRREMTLCLGDGQHLVTQLADQALELHRIIIGPVLPATDQRAAADLALEGGRCPDREAIVGAVPQQGIPQLRSPPVPACAPGGSITPLRICPVGARPVGIARAEVVAVRTGIVAAVDRTIPVGRLLRCTLSTALRRTCLSGHGLRTVRGLSGSRRTGLPRRCPAC